MLRVQVKMVCTAAVPPQELFRERLQHASEEQESRVLMDDLEITEVRTYEEDQFWINTFPGQRHKSLVC